MEKAVTSRIKRTCFRQPIQTVLCSGFLILLSFFPSLNARSEPSPSLSSIDTLAKELNTPEALEKFMGKKFHYVSDRLLFHQDEYWQTPEEILARGAGDCEDYALFAEAILKRNGYQVVILSLFWDDNAHTVAVFEKNGTWGIFNLDKIQYTNARSLAELADQINHEWMYVGVMRQEGMSGIISRKFQGRNAHDAGVTMIFPHLVPATAASATNS